MEFIVVNCNIENKRGHPRIGSPLFRMLLNLATSSSVATTTTAD